jgi:hypothetical protein
MRIIIVETTKNTKMVSVRWIIGETFGVVFDTITWWFSCEQSERKGHPTWSSMRYPTE